jgi:hypothetical protein
MDEIKLSRVLEGFRDVKVFGYFGINSGILFIPPVQYGMQVAASDRIPASEQCHVPATGDESFSDVASHRFPSAIFPRRSSPGYRR